MSHSGIQNPDVVDLTTQAPDGTVRLILVETDALSGEHIPALKQKLDNYITFAQGGQLVKSHPAARGCRVCLRVDLYAQPHELVVMFLRSYRTLAAKEGFGVEVSLNQQDLEL
jgi:hypothetical protein